MNPPLGKRSEQQSYSPNVDISEDDNEKLSGVPVLISPDNPLAINSAIVKNIIFILI